jgi:HlyD family secretion protein
VIIKVENVRGSLLAGMTCAVDFIVENSEDVLMVPNAALRYQPVSLSAETVADMVFNASLKNMSDEQQQAALKAREQTIAQNVSQTTNTGLTDLMMGQNTGTMAGRQFNPGGRQGQGQRQGRNTSPAVVMRNLWYINNDGKLDVMQVQIGISSGSFTELRTTDDLEGKQVILREKV